MSRARPGPLIDFIPPFAQKPAFPAPRFIPEPVNTGRRANRQGSRGFILRPPVPVTEEGAISA